MMIFLTENQRRKSPAEVLKIDPEELKVEYWDEARYRKKADDLEEDCRKNCYIWVVLGGTKEHPVFSYNFRWTRSGKNVLDFLEDYEGNVIQSDGYSGYNAAINYWNLSHPDHKIELLNCWVHARRGFADAVKATSTNGQGPYAFGYLKPLTHSFAGLKSRIKFILLYFTASIFSTRTSRGSFVAAPVARSTLTIMYPPLFFTAL